MNYDPIIREYNGAAHRALCDNRELSFIQSHLSRDGNVATLAEARAYAAEQMADADNTVIPYADRRGI